MLPCVLDLTMLYITSNRTAVTSDPTYESQCEKKFRDVKTAAECDVYSSAEAWV